VSRPSARHRLEFTLYRVLTAALNALPERPAVALGGALGWIAGVLLRIRRDVVDENLRRVFPEQQASWRREVAVRSYRHLGREAVVAFRIGRYSRENLLARSEVNGLDALFEAVRGPGALVAAGHVGNWEVAGGVLALRGVPIDAIAVRQRNPLFETALSENRRKLGVRVVYRGVAGSDVLRSIRAGRVPVLLADQDAGGGGVFVDFLGREASTAKGPALLALRSGARLFSGTCVVVPGTPPRYRIDLEAVDAPRSGDLARDVRALTQAHADALARAVREAPDQYFWHHKRWKTRPQAEKQERRPLPAV
jgi:KDO2-lipid IV(A) lauroyltransferase